MESPELPGHEIQTPELVSELRAAASKDVDCLRVDAGRLFRLFFLFGNFLVGYPAFLFRRNHWQRLGGIDAQFRVASDLDFLRRLCLLGPAAFADERLFLRRAHQTNLSQSSLAQRTMVMDGMLLYQRFLPCRLLYDDPADLPRVREWIVEMSSWFRGLDIYGAEMRWLRTWLAVDPEGRALLRDHLQTWFVHLRDTGKTGRALRVLYQVGLFFGWERQTLVTAASIALAWCAGLPIWLPSR